MNILIADEDTVSRGLLREILSSERSYCLTEVDSGTNCWEALHGETLPDLCLMEVDLPGMSGLEVLERMRSEERLRDVPVLIVTARSDIHARASAAALGAYAFVIKPFDPVRLFGLAREAIQCSGRVFRPYGFEERESVLEREELDLTSYFKLMTLFVEHLAARLESMERLLRLGEFGELKRMIQPILSVARRVGGTTFVEYLGALEELPETPSPEDLRLASRRMRLLRVEFRELRDELERYLQVVIAIHPGKKIATRPEMKDWTGESIRLSAEIEEGGFDDRSGFALGSETILLKGFRGDETIAVARLEVKGGHVVVSGLFDDTGELSFDLNRLMPMAEATLWQRGASAASSGSSGRRRRIGSWPGSPARPRRK